MTSVSDILKIGTDPSNSRTVGLTNAGKGFTDRLESNGSLTATSHIVVDLYESLSLTDKGHATDAAIIMGLAGDNPQDVVIDEIPTSIELVTRSGRLSVVSGARIVDSPVTKNVIFHSETSPRHGNGMRIIAWKGREELLGKTYYSVGGEFIAEEEHSGLSYDVETSAPYDFHSAGELLKMCDYNDLSISGLMMYNKLALRSKAKTGAGFARIWQVMHDGIERGMNTEGALSGPPNVLRRVVALRCQLVSSSNISNGPINAADWTNVYALAVSEESTADGCVIAAPTNGACGTIPAVLAYYDRFRRSVSGRSIACYFLTVGAIGALYETNASISGAEIGCQGEISMVYSVATVRLTELLDGSLVQVCNVAGITMKHSLESTCNPVAGQVRIPCIERDIINVVKAVNTTWVVMCRTPTPRISFDRVIRAMYETGKDMNDKYRGTSRGGLVIKVVCG